RTRRAMRANQFARRAQLRIAAQTKFARAVVPQRIYRHRLSDAQMWKFRARVISNFRKRPRKFVTHHERRYAQRVVSEISGQFGTTNTRVRHLNQNFVRRDARSFLFAQRHHARRFPHQRFHVFSSMVSHARRAAPNKPASSPNTPYAILTYSAE